MPNYTLSYIRWLLIWNTNLKKNITKYFWITAVLFLILQFSVSAQNADAQLALKYYQNQEYDKAATLYEKLYRETGYKNNRDYYLRCLSELNSYNFV